MRGQGLGMVAGGREEVGAGPEGGAFSGRSQDAWAPSCPHRPTSFPGFRLRVQQEQGRGEFPSFTPVSTPSSWLGLRRKEQPDVSPRVTGETHHSPDCWSLVLLPGLPPYDFLAKNAQGLETKSLIPALPLAGRVTLGKSLYFLNPNFLVYKSEVMSPSLQRRTGPEVINAASLWFAGGQLLMEPLSPLLLR